MTKLTRIAAALALVAAVGAVAATSVPRARAAAALPLASRARESAEIIPAGSINVGTAFTNGTGGGLGYGYGLYATGISDYWVAARSRSSTQNFVIFVFPGVSSVDQSIAVTVTSPSGGMVYAYTFAKKKIYTEGSWYSISATGNFTTAGTYAVTVRADGTVIGRIPLVFSPAGH